MEKREVKQKAVWLTLSRRNCTTEEMVEHTLSAQACLSRIAVQDSKAGKQRTEWKREVIDNVVQIPQVVSL
jgi:hypothetical protein